MSSDDKSLKERLQKMESQLQQLVESAEEDLALAKELQSALTPTEIPKLPGLQGTARYKSAYEMSAESFDLIPSADKKELWIIQYWSSSFGLSSVMLRSLVKIKAQQILNSGPSNEPETVFDSLTESLLSVKKGRKAKRYRLGVYRLKLSTLQLQGVSLGQLPPLVREMHTPGSQQEEWGTFKWAQPEALISNPQLLEARSSDEAISALAVYRPHVQLQTGSRFYFMGRTWAEDTSLEELGGPLNLHNYHPDKDADNLVDNLNHLGLQIEEHMKAKEVSADNLLLGFQVDSHLLYETV